MNKSDTIATLAASLTQAQAKIGGAVKDAQNPFFKSSYADLGSVMSVCKGPLLEHGISVLQLVGSDGNGGYLETVLLHESGEFISDRMKLVCAKQHDPQAMGSAISYARRYALQSALFIPAVDDDAEHAMTTTRALQKEDEDIQNRQTKREREQARVGHEEPQTAFQAAQQMMKDWRSTAIHFGKNKGTQLGELNSRQLEWYANDWLEKKQESAKPVSFEDRMLIEALLSYKRSIRDGLDGMKDVIRDPDEIPMAPVEPETVEALPF